MLLVSAAGFGHLGGRSAWAETTESLAGKLLVAAPSMRDSNFTGTVIYMVEHDAEGAMGLVINRRLGAGPVVDLLKGLGLPTEGTRGDIELFSGGPVGPKQGFILHTPDYTTEDAIKVNKDFTLSFDPNVLRDIGLGRGPKSAIFAFGYSGWGPGQLESELRRKAWVVVTPDPALVFESNVAEKWKKALAREELDL